MSLLLPGIIILAAILVISVIASGYVKSPPDRAFIISGYRKEPKILIGRAGINWFCHAHSGVWKDGRGISHNQERNMNYE